ncbi:Uncharacterized membrane protein YckC, RDD family [Streptomyces sp. WMMB 714]|nr:Uncharacterized membrane protein YckC, RDD family [Streptomyces sp. WMMB 714]
MEAGETVDELVTGDAVVLGLRPARLLSRGLAVFVDLALAWAVYLLLSLGLLAAVSSLDAAAVAAVQVALFLLVLVGVPIAVETLSRGRSVGKALCGLRVVREDGGPVRFRQALVRGALGVVEITVFFGVVACAASLVSSRGRRLGDVFAGTLVVRERVPAMRGLPAPPVSSPGGSFGELDLSQVPGGLWLAVRQYLTRAGQLDEAVSRSMAERLAADVASFTGVPAPEGVPAVAYLAGVVAERQAREMQRTFGAQVPGAWAAAPDSGVAAGAPGQADSTSVHSRKAPERPAVHSWAPVHVPPSAPATGPPASTYVAGGRGGRHTDGAGRPSAGGEKRRTGFVPPA